MRRRFTRKEKRRKSKQVIMISTVCLILILGVGYASFQTNLTLKAKGNIKCSGTIAKELLLKEVVNSGDGLYNDTYEPTRYFYKGTSPKNYITFNNDMWRIISLEEDGSLKIIKDESIGQKGWPNNIVWDEPVEINTYLNKEYLNSISTNYDKIISHDFKIGIIKELVNDDLTNQIYEENQTIWNGKIGLISVSEYLRLNSNIGMCGTAKKAQANASTCKTTTWLLKSFFWAISETDDIGTSIKAIIVGDGAGPAVAFGDGMLADIHPVIYISKETKLCGGGTEENPYTITN